jgi:signal transduction histidine kinase
MITILYVEDDQVAGKVLFSMLARSYPELRFFAASNGQEGLKRFLELRPDIVITDISMPGMDGITMSAEIKAVAPETVIIAVTAQTETKNLLRAIEIGINQYLLKPVDFPRLSSLLDQAIATVRRGQQLREQYEQITALNAALAARSAELENVNCELEAFNFTVAHDLRSPLVSISGFSQLLLDKYGSALDENGVESLQVIYRQTLRMSGLIDALLNFSRCTRKSIVKQWADFSSIANEIMANLLLREPQRRVTATIADGVRGFADPVLIGVVLENLLGNAWKYTALQEDARIEFGVDNCGEELVYYVRDNGAGFDQQEATGLFVPFQRLQDGGEFEGFGVGLATACRIVQRHGGKIWADGEKGRGATFYFSL